MNRLPFLLSSIALATLAGCAESGITLVSEPLVAQPPSYAVGAAGKGGQAGAGGTVAASPAATALRAGFGRVESILVVPTTDAAGRPDGRASSPGAVHPDESRYGRAVVDRPAVLRTKIEPPRVRAGEDCSHSAREGNHVRTL